VVAADSIRIDPPPPLDPELAARILASPDVDAAMRARARAALDNG
jgi:hypothetical protein